MIKKDFLFTFIERLNTHQIIRTQPFLTLYNEWFIEVQKGLENEIHENLQLSTTEKRYYLDYVKKRITEDVAYQNDNHFLDKWIKKYALGGLNFPFIENEHVEQILGTSVNVPDLDYNEKKLATNIQMDFYCYGAMIEKYKMIAFIDKLLEMIKQHTEIPEEEIGVNTEYKEKSEKSKDAEEEAASDYTKSTIEEYLFDLVDDINQTDYKRLVDTLHSYFKTGKFPILKHQIRFKSVNKKKVGWALKEAYKNVTFKKLDIEYFRFAKDNINLFSEEIIEIENFRQSKFYKMFTTNPKNKGYT